MPECVAPSVARCRCKVRAGTPTASAVEDSVGNSASIWREMALETRASSAPWVGSEVSNPSA